jgi:hypothetical protein
VQVIFNDGIMEVTYFPEGWLFLRWVDNKIGHLEKQLVKDLIWAEKHILVNKLKGWFTSSELAHTDFHMILHKVGAKFMGKDTDYCYFNKWIEKPEDAYHVRFAR